MSFFPTDLLSRLQLQSGETLQSQSSDPGLPLGELRISDLLLNVWVRLNSLGNPDLLRGAESRWK